MAPRGHSTTLASIPIATALLVAIGMARVAPIAAGPVRTIAITATDEGFDPKRITAGPMEPLTIELINGSSRELDLVFELEDGRVERMPPIPPRGAGEIAFDAPVEAGIYAFYSALPGTGEAGYLGALVVGDVETIVVEGFNFAYSPDILRVNAGKWVNIAFTSTNGFHDLVFWLEGGRVEASARVTTGATTYITFRAPELAATYAFFCSVSDHRDFGMEGRLIVEDAETIPTATATASGESTVTPTDGSGRTPTATGTPVVPPVATTTPATSATPATGTPIATLEPTAAPLASSIFLPISHRGGAHHQ